jgi:hypothetical protein
VGRVELTLEEYQDLLAKKPTRRSGAPRTRPKKVKKVSAYSKRYGAAFKRIAPKNKKKGGGWKQGGFMRTQKAAHKEAKR